MMSLSLLAGRTVCQSIQVCPPNAPQNKCFVFILQPIICQSLGPFLNPEYMGFDVRNPVSGVFNQIRFIPSAHLQRTARKLKLCM